MERGVRCSFPLNSRAGTWLVVSSKSPSLSLLPSFSFYLFILVCWGVVVGYVCICVDTFIFWDSLSVNLKFIYLVRVVGRWVSIIHLSPCQHGRYRLKTSRSAFYWECWRFGPRPFTDPSLQPLLNSRRIRGPERGCYLTRTPSQSA